MKLPVKPGKYRKVGTTKLGKVVVNVAEWTGKEREVEYWECNACFDEASYECWLEKKIEKLYGKRCPDYEPHCALCAAWLLYDAIIGDNRGCL
jgi:hypothetical protein